MRTPKAAPIALLVWASACSDAKDQSPVDATTSVDAAVATCPFPPGETYIVTQMHSLDPQAGFDLDGDGDPDNTFGSMPPVGRQLFDGNLDDGIANGSIILLLHVGDWAAPPTADDGDVTLYQFAGIDADNPQDPANNTSGMGRFYVPMGSFDIDCRSISVCEHGTIAGRALAAKGVSWRIYNTFGAGYLEWMSPTIELTFAPDFNTGQGRLGAALTACSLSRSPLQIIDATALEMIVNSPALMAAIDMDLDGDGLEQILGDGQRITHCIDGDGTVIMGADCACHPKIADAYSMAASIQVVRATVLGVQ